MKKLSKEELLQRAKEYAISRDGECLATEYISAKTKDKWKCENLNHPIFETDFQCITRGNWCSLCAIEKNAKKNMLSNGLDKAIEHAKKYEGECLSTEYKNARTNLQWKCKAGHTWESNFDHAVTRDRWCQQCFYDEAIIPDAYNQIQKRLKKENGTAVISENDKIKAHTKIEWSCENENDKPWIAEFRNVITDGGWCPYCAGKFSTDEYLELAKNHALSKEGGECLSTEYIDQKTNLIWNCKEHGSWEDSYRNVVSRDLWCKKCRNIHTPEEYLEFAKQYAISQGGECLSDKYLIQADNLTWNCKKHGIWKSSYTNIVTHNRWCPTCFKEGKQKECLNNAYNYAQKMGGQCLTKQFNNSNDIFEWKCHDDTHPKWQAKYNTVMGNKSWCPECGIYYQKENQVRKLLEYLLGFNLNKAKPSWNINPKTGYLLELDGYNEVKKIAFEYQGRHHYENNVFTNANQTLEEVQYKDKIKAEHCKNKEIQLLIIDGRKKLETSKRMLKFLQNLLDENEMTYKKNIDYNEVESIYNEARVKGWDSKNKIKLSSV